MRQGFLPHKNAKCGVLRRRTAFSFLRSILIEGQDAWAEMAEKDFRLQCLTPPHLNVQQATNTQNNTFIQHKTQKDFLTHHYMKYLCILFMS